MTKTYKHKHTGDIVELKSNVGYSLNKNTIGLIPIDYIEKSNDWELVVEEKPILFVTEDGKGLKEGDFVTTVDNNYLKISIESMTITKDCNQETAKKMGYLWFSTKEKALEYIILRKPCLSINDVLQHIRCTSKTLDENGLKELVKSKM